MNIGAFGENFPYSNFHDLNMDWIIKIAKDFLDQYTNIQETITNGLDELNTTADRLNELLNEWYTTHSEDIANQLADALSDLNAWYTEHITAFRADATAIGNEVIASIPEDYTALENDVETLKNKVDNRYTLELISGTSIDRTTGEVVSEAGYSATQFIDIRKSPILEITGISRGSSQNAFYDSSYNYISGFTVYEDRHYVEIPNNAYYARLSGQTAMMESMIINKISNTEDRLYDVTIAGSTSKYKDIADYFCTDDSDDDDIINAILRSPKVKKVYFYSDSNFILNAPIVLPKDGMIITGNKPTFTQPAMVTTQLTSPVTSGNRMYVADITGFKIGQYVYIADNNGQNTSKIISAVHSGEYPSIEFTTNFEEQWTPTDGTVIKTANPAFVLNNRDVMVIDNITINWNVAQNPIQQYNPMFLQEGISVQYSSKIHITNCILLNGGRRGICCTDSKDITIENCFIKNWHEHAIDIFNGYMSEGNTPTLPMLNNCVITKVIACNNGMNGIQLHRGSGCIVSNCVCYDNADIGIGTAEYARDNIIIGNLCYGGERGIVVRTGSFGTTVANNKILNTSIHGIYIAGRTDMRCTTIKLCNNHINYTPRQAILVEYSDFITINDNLIKNASMDTNESWQAISGAFCTHTVVRDNDISKNDSIEIASIRIGGNTSDYNVIINNVTHNYNPVENVGSHDVVRDNILF